MFSDASVAPRTSSAIVVIFILSLDLECSGRLSLITASTTSELAAQQLALQCLLNMCNLGPVVILTDSREAQLQPVGEDRSPPFVREVASRCPCVEDGNNIYRFYSDLTNILALGVSRILCVSEAAQFYLQSILLLSFFFFSCFQTCNWGRRPVWGLRLKCLRTRRFYACLIISSRSSCYTSYGHNLDRNGDYEPRRQSGTSG